MLETVRRGNFIVMATVLRYGADSTLTLDVPPDVLVADCGGQPGAPLENPAAAVAAALGDPLAYPSLVEATVPGDRIALVLGGGVPQTSAVVAGVVRTLLAGHSQPEDIAIVRTEADARFSHKDPTAMLPETVRRKINVVTHDPSDPTELAYLAASKDNRPILINRVIFDADLVVPIGCLRVEESLGWAGIHEGLFPRFSDDEARQRFQAPGSVYSPVARRRRKEQADEVAWLLGVRLTVQLVPGAGGRVLHVLAGEADAVAARGRQLCREAWDYRIPRRASLVVATVEGAGDEQTWENVARALLAASRAVDDDGAIALCTDLDCRPGPALQCLGGTESLDEAIRQIRRHRTPDALAASQLGQLLDRVKVYLLSRLEEEVVEQMGLAPVSGVDEIVRLSRRHESCIVLANAQHTLPTPQDEIKAG